MKFSKFLTESSKNVRTIRELKSMLEKFNDNSKVCVWPDADYSDVGAGVNIKFDKASNTLRLEAPYKQ